jgi:hypothetical protein
MNTMWLNALAIAFAAVFLGAVVREFRAGSRDDADRSPTRGDPSQEPDENP